MLNYEIIKQDILIFFCGIFQSKLFLSCISLFSRLTTILRYYTLIKYKMKTLFLLSCINKSMYNSQSLHVS